MLDTTTAAQVRRRLLQFISEVGAAESLPAKRFLTDALTGLLASGDIKLSSWSRSLNERQKLLYTEKRLSRWMGSRRLSDAELWRRYVRLISGHLGRHIIAVDGSEIAKPAARSMPFLERVIDGSKPKTTFADGWRLLGIEAVGADGTHAPLALKLYSTADPSYKSEKAELRQAIAEVAPHVPSSCIWAFDRGYDSRATIEMCEAFTIRYVLRLRAANRKVFVDGAWKLAKDVAARGRFAHRYTTLRSGWTVRLDFKKVRLHAMKAAFRTPRLVGGKRVPADAMHSMVMIKGKKGVPPIVLLTNLDVRSYDDAEVVAEAYLQRLGIEETFRFIKQTFNLEDVRVLRWKALRRAVLMATLAYGFLCRERYVAPGRYDAIVLQMRRAFGAAPRFFFYRLRETVGALLGLLYLIRPARPRSPPRGKRR